MDRYVASLAYRKATKGKYVYGERGEQPLIQSLYLEKGVLMGLLPPGASPPPRIQVTVEVA